MEDGSQLGARLWLPKDSDTKPVPGILEYIPYRKDDYSAIRDSSTIAWFAQFGYACIRVDMRGSGSSDGVLDDEYSLQEIDDGVAVINWMAQQDWCDGNVGTIGISWGGITGLQIAQRNPEALKTVIALGASEFRYYDDAGYYMGCMVGQTIGWAAIMFGYNFRPPDPNLIGDRWRDLWLERLNNTPHYLDHFLTHQREDEYWLRGTVGTDYSAIKVPVYAVSGHADCWPNTVARLLENLEVPRRGLQGAWCHRYPHLGIPGPTVDFLGDALRWFDQWLKQMDTGIMSEAMYQVYLQDGVPPKPYYDHRPGKWVSEPSWPSEQIAIQSFYLGQGLLSDETQPASTCEFCSPQSVGMASGEYMPWFAFGPSNELPDDQQSEDQGSLIFDTSVLQQDMEILGNVTAELHLTCDQLQGLVAARLCEVWPNGESTLITRGILNLCQRTGKQTPTAMIPGSWERVEVELNHTGYKVSAGNRLRLAISTSYWPMAWPSPAASTVTIDTQLSRLDVPVRNPLANNTGLTTFGDIQSIPPLQTNQLREFEQRRESIIDEETGMHILEIWADNGKIQFENNGIEMASTTLQRYSIHPDDPLSARAEYEWVWEYSRGEQWKTKTFTRTDMYSDAQNFYVESEVVAREGETEIHNRKDKKSYKRDFF